MTMTTSVVLGDDATTTPAAVAGFLAGYCGATRRSYATDLRIFADWCAEGRLELFARATRPPGAEAASHADPRTTMRYDRGRGSFDRHATYVVATFLAGASR